MLAKQALLVRPDPLALLVILAPLALLALKVLQATLPSLHYLFNLNLV